MYRKHWIILFIFLAAIIACKKEVIESSFRGFQKPANFPEPAYHFASNKVTKEGFELGRKLFYDRRLSADNSISCGNCHLQNAAFTHPGHSVSHGIHDLLGSRNTQPIMNLAWSNSFMWDGGVFDLDLQPIAPITNRVEMGETMINVISKLSNDPQYPVMFQKAFGTTEVNSSNMLKALSQFMVSCVSANAKYDSVMRHEGNVFTADETSGYHIYRQKCSSCHAEPLFTDNRFRNNGILPSGRNDSGRYLITLNASDKYKFKVPSLRNLSYTAPYMHDGRFFSIDAVLDHYSDHVQNTENLDPLLQQGGQLGISMTADEKAQLKIFLKTLDDRDFITNPLLSEQ